MARLGGLLLLALLLAGCTVGSDRPSTPDSTASPALASPSPDAATLLARPLKLPAMAPGSPCPVTPVASRTLDVSSPRGHGPFYLGGPMPQGNFAFNKTVWVLVDGAPGPVLFRGGRIDGVGNLRFSGAQADPSEAGTNPPGHVSTSFFRAVISGGTGDGFYIWPSTTGCYALQADGPTFEVVIVLTATG